MAPSASVDRTSVRGTAPYSASRCSTTKRNQTGFLIQRHRGGGPRPAGLTLSPPNSPRRSRRTALFDDGGARNNHYAPGCC